MTCLYSIGDNNSYLHFNRDPVDRVIAMLTQHFRPDEIEEGLSLAISGGVGGARLSHNHQRQYTFVLQSLTLWREISHDMFKLWYLAEQDILAENNRYTLAGKVHPLPPPLPLPLPPSPSSCLRTFLTSVNSTRTVMPSARYDRLIRKEKGVGSTQLTIHRSFSLHTHTHTRTRTHTHRMCI